MSHLEVSDELWGDFHTVVNMTSRELEDWLRVEGSSQDAEALPDQAGKHLGRRVLGILGKRRTDLTEEDVHAMQKVVREVRGQRDPELEPKAGDERWRHHLMDLGHDPLKPVAHPGGGHA
ncbi:MAG TPA: DUF3140 domain-containing protein [Marmoricola sp.]|nr:DUF3140 domain-containing protein [Marmoricola sp.]